MRAISIALVALATFFTSLLPTKSYAVNFGRSHHLKLVDQKTCLIATIHQEARGESRFDRRAIGWTVLNRTHAKGFARTPCGVIKQHKVYHHKVYYQFPWAHNWTPTIFRTKIDWIRAYKDATYVLSHKPKGCAKRALYFNRRFAGIRAHVKKICHGSGTDFFAPVKG